MTYLQLPDSFVNLVKEIHERFDIISFFEVLEHLDNPVRFIEHIRGLLKPGGHIIPSVPNRNSFLDTLAESDYPPNHLTR